MNINYVLDDNVKKLSTLAERGIGEIGEERLYENIEDIRLKFCFGAFQNQFNIFFSFINEKIHSNNHFNAAESRNLISLIQIFKEMQSALFGTEFAFNIRNSYEEKLDFIKPHLSNMGGSTIPEDYKRLDIVKYEPIITLDKQIKRQNKNDKQLFSLKLVDAGSYATVYRFKDSFYNQTFALKRANKDLTFTELNRFKKEFEVMRELDSPYILKVYTFKEQDNEFIMEYVDQTLQHYIDKNNSSLQFSRRRQLVFQVFSAFNYIYSRRILHRDISYSNILVKVHDDNSTIIKVSDFGYLKEPESTLTRQNTEFKGSLNDPALKFMGVDKYSIQHEIYALTQLIYFIMTGRKNLQNSKNESVTLFLDYGMNPDLEKRAKNLSELKEKFKKTDW